MFNPLSSGIKNLFRRAAVVYEQWQLHHLQAALPWDDQFQPVFELRYFSVAAKNRIFDAIRYNNLKREVIKDFSAITKEHPEFRPKISFDDKQNAILIGYALDELRALLTDKSKVARFITASNPYSSYSFKTGEPHAWPRQGKELIKEGESIPFTLNGGHADFNDKAREAMKHAPPRSYSLPAPPQGWEPRDADIIEHIADQAQATGKPFRLVVGEKHENIAVRRLLIQSMEKIKEAGAALCLEHFFYQTQQPLLDRWISDPDPQAPMPLELRRYAAYRDNQFKLFSEHANDYTGFTDLLLAAKQHGVRVVAIDTDAVYYKSSLPGGGLRIRDMNYIASKIIGKEIGEGGFVALVGEAHCAQYKENAAAVPLPGLDQLCNALSLIVFDGYGARSWLMGQQVVDSRFGKEYRKTTIKPDLILITDPTSLGKGLQGDQRRETGPMRGQSTPPDPGPHP